MQQAFRSAPLSAGRPAEASVLLHLYRSSNRLDGFFSVRHSISMPTTETVDIYAIRLPFKGLLTVRSDNTQHDH